MVDRGIQTLKKDLATRAQATPQDGARRAEDVVKAVQELGAVDSMTEGRDFAEAGAAATRRADETEAAGRFLGPPRPRTLN